MLRQACCGCKNAHTQQPRAVKRCVRGASGGGARYGARARARGSAAAGLSAAGVRAHTAAKRAAREKVMRGAASKSNNRTSIHVYHIICQMRIVVANGEGKGSGCGE